MIPSAVYQWAIAAAVAGVIGLTLAILGLRGKRVGTQPFCARCGFDLSGTIGATAAAGTAMPCPECGKDTAARGAVRLGTRRRRIWLACLGLIFALGGSSGSGWMAFSAAKGANWKEAKPTWVLVAQADGILSRADQAVLDELLAREKAGRLSDGDLRTLVPRAIAAQADMSRVWDSRWGDLVARAHQRGVATEAQCQKFMEQVVSFSPAFRPVVRTAQWTHYEMRAGVQRGPSMSGMRGLPGVVWRRISLEIALEGVGTRIEWKSPNDNFPQYDFMTDQFGYPIADVYRHAQWTALPGKYTVALDLSYRIGFTHLSPKDSGWTVRTRTSVPVDIAPIDQPTVRLVADDNTAELLRRTLRVRLSGAPSYNYYKETPHGHERVPKQEVYMDISCEALPVGVSMVGTIRSHGSGGVPDKVESMMIEPHDTRGSGHIVLPGDYAAERVDLVLRPAPLIAEQGSLICTEVWDGELVFENIPIVWTKAGATWKPRTDEGVLPARVTSPAPAPPSASQPGGS